MVESDQANKKRKTVVRDDDHAIMPMNRMEGRGSPMRAGRTPEKPKVQESFLLQKRSFYQQHIEAINEAMQQQLAEMDESESGRFESNQQHFRLFWMACEQIRAISEVERLYHFPAGIVVSMGQDDCAQLGINTDLTDDEEGKEPSYSPTVVPQLLNYPIIQVAAGGLHSAALTDDGYVYTWGCNDDGALGRITQTDLEQALPTKLPPDGFHPEDYGEIVAVVAGNSHTLYLTLKGHVYMCGMYKDIDSGKFRDVPSATSSTKNRPTCMGCNFIPVKVSNLTQPVKQIACGASFNAAILADDTMVTWGT